MPWCELRAFAAVLSCKAARDFLTAHGVGASVFTDPDAMEVAHVMLTGAALPPDWPTWRVDPTHRLLEWAHDYRPESAAGAVARVRVLCEQRGLALLPPVLRWGADAIDKQWLPLERVRSELRRAFALAEGMAA